MSLFLEILKCILCCADEPQHEFADEPLIRVRNYSPERRERLIDTTSRYNLSSSESTRSTYSPWVNGSVSSYSVSTKYVPISSSSPSKSEKLSSSKPIQSRSNHVGVQSEPALRLKAHSSIQSTSSATQTVAKPFALPSTEVSFKTQQLNKPGGLFPFSSSSQTKETFAKLSASPSSEVSSKAQQLYKPVRFPVSSPTSIWQRKESISKPSPSPSSPGLSSSTGQQTNRSYTVEDKPIYKIPEEMKNLIEKDVVPDVLKRPLSKSTYKVYFAALLYAEDYYIEKWGDFKIEDTTFKLDSILKPENANILKRSNNSKRPRKEVMTIVKLELDPSAKKRPFFLSRDFVFVTPSGSEAEPFQGTVYRVVKSTTLLVEFEEDFYSQHYPNCKYDVRFGLNRVCLKRAHQAIETASDALFRNFIFPDRDFRKSISAPTPAYSSFKLNADQKSAIREVLACQGAPPYLIEGSLSENRAEWGNRFLKLTETGVMVKEAVLKFFESSQTRQILLCAPTNSTCDLLTQTLKNVIPESDIFRANAAFRELDEVPDDIIPSCLYKDKDECFACPQLERLKKYRVVISTYMSSYRLRNEGIPAGHFSHIFLLDASSVTEPESMVPLSNLANENTTVIVKGILGNRTGWVRSNMARNHGLNVSYFERLSKRHPYNSFNSEFISKVKSDGVW